MADTNPLLITGMDQHIIANMTMLNQAATANHQSALNNHSRNSEVLGKRIVEWDGAETVAHAEGYTRVSPVSAPYHLANGMTEISGAIQNNQNNVNQSYAQLLASIEGLKAMFVNK